LACILWSTPVFLTKTFAAIISGEYQNIPVGEILHIHDDAGDYELESEFIWDLARHDMDQYLQVMSDKPVLIIHARDDEVVSVENAQYLNSKLAQASLCLIDAAGHRFLEKTEERENLTLAWLEKQIEEL